MALITCPECGKEFSDRADACPICGCPTNTILDTEKAMGDEIMDPENISEQEGSGRESLKKIAGVMSNLASSTAEKLKENYDTFKATKRAGPISIDERSLLFQIHGAVPVNGKKSGLIGKTIKGTMAVGTLGLSTLVTRSNKRKVGTKDWYEFGDLIGYELIEDDSIVTSGGVGQALVGGALFGAAGAIAGGITGKRTQRKKIESLVIKVTLNSFESPCVLIPLITKPTKVSSKEYQVAFAEAHQILSALDVITHNK